MFKFYQKLLLELIMIQANMGIMEPLWINSSRLKGVADGADVFANSASSYVESLNSPS
jgi:hypothetical protein